MSDMNVETFRRDLVDAIRRYDDGKITFDEVVNEVTRAFDGVWDKAYDVGYEDATAARLDEFEITLEDDDEDEDA